MALCHRIRPGGIGQSARRHRATTVPAAYLPTKLPRLTAAAAAATREAPVPRGLFFWETSHAAPRPDMQTSPPYLTLLKRLN